MRPLLPALLLSAAPAFAATSHTPVAAPGPLRYVRADNGLDFPKWEGGRSEIEMADLNGDGHIDLVAIGDHGSPHVNSDEHGLMVYLGDGRGNWSVHMSGEFGYGGVAVGDLNGDGLADVAYGMHHNWGGGDFGDQLIEAALGDGSGAHWSPWDDGLATEGEDWGMFGTDLADVDDDGDLDLAAISFGGSSGLHVYLNHGNGTWSQSWGFLGGNSNEDVCFGDVNGDGFADLCASHDSGTIFLGDGSGGFSDGDGDLPGSPATRMGGPSLGDVDGDGRDDLAWANRDGGIEVWLSRPPLHWVDASLGLPRSGSFAGTQLWDLDGDGTCEVVAQGRGLVTLFRARGGRWREETSVTTTNPGSHSALRVGGDIDHNGHADFVAIATKNGALFDRNQVIVFAEASRAKTAAIRFERLAAGRVLHSGAALFLRYAAAIPPAGAENAQVDLFYSATSSGGPWETVATAQPASGILQVVLPAAATGPETYLRLMLRSNAGDAEAISPALRVE
jgi:hypothetical protein